MVEVSIKIIEPIGAAYDLLCDVRRIALKAERWPELKDTARALAVITEALEGALEEMESQHNVPELDTNVQEN